MARLPIRVAESGRERVADMTEIRRGRLRRGQVRVVQQKKGGKHTPYEIVFATGTMIQKITPTSVWRKVRRLVFAA